MASVLTIMLGVSIAALMVLLILKRREMRTGRIMFASSRPTLRRASHTILVIVEQVVPSIAKHTAGKSVRFVRESTHRFVARAILMFETTLERVLHTVRTTSQPMQGGGEVSNFLREVAAHKRAILKRAPSKRAIFED